MPLYDYDCANCGQRFEILRGVHADPPSACPLCGGGPIKKAFATPALHFKGSGWAKKERRATVSPEAQKATGGSDSDASPASNAGGSGSDTSSGTGGSSGADGSSESKASPSNGGTTTAAASASTTSPSAGDGGSSSKRKAD